MKEHENDDVDDEPEAAEEHMEHCECKTELEHNPVSEREGEESLDESTCEPVHKIIFAKTHKTGSSTIQNILLRYGVKNDLVFAMPPDSWMFHIIDAFNADNVLKGPWKDLGGFDIFAFHCRWNYDEVTRIIPDAKHITILREPLSTFESNYVYMGAQSARKADLNEFAQKFAANGEKRNERAYVGQNNLLWDLGVNVKDLDKMDVVDAKIQEVEEKFDLVMIMERFEESLVLLADTFCWPLEEVMYIKQNERLAEIRNVPTEETKEIMKVWLRGDYKVCPVIFYPALVVHCTDLRSLSSCFFPQLYEHFMDVFDKKIEAYGRQRMTEDVARLRQMNIQIKEECVMKEVGPAEDKKKAGLNAVYTFETAKDKPWCYPYTRRETEYCKMIREHQHHRVQEMRLKGLIKQQN